MYRAIPTTMNRLPTSWKEPCTSGWASRASASRELTVRAGEVLVIPSNLPHRALALEDTLDVDVFNPPRQDWLAGTDDYLRR
jgi:ribosomal protein L16 Arg81 hydroxylase